MLISVDGNTLNAQLFATTICTFWCYWILATGTLLPVSSATKLVKDLLEQCKHQELDRFSCRYHDMQGASLMKQSRGVGASGEWS